MTGSQDIVQAWLTEFEAKVRSRDFEGGRSLFEPSVLGYGSRLTQAEGLDPLVAGQWKRVWPNIEGFRFLRESMRVFGDPSAGTLSVALSWTSTGISPEGERYERPGRCTLVLQRGGNGEWRCAHSHYSTPLDVSQDLREIPS
jgi:ketosteroid isomerase-like protein